MVLPIVTFLDHSHHPLDTPQKFKPKPLVLLSFVVPIEPKV